MAGRRVHGCVSGPAVPAIERLCPLRVRGRPAVAVEGSGQAVDTGHLHRRCRGRLGRERDRYAGRGIWSLASIHGGAVAQVRPFGRVILMMEMTMSFGASVRDRRIAEGI